MPTEREIAAEKEEAKVYYDKLLSTYELLKGENVNMPKHAERAMKAQMSVFAGIYNRDYALYKRGVDKYAKYGNPEKYNDMVDVAVLASDDPSLHDALSSSSNQVKTFYDRKLALYKSLHNSYRTVLAVVP